MTFRYESNGGKREGHERQAARTNARSSAWFLCHQSREAMKPETHAPIGGQNKAIEVGETFIGGKNKNRAFAKREPKGQVVMTFVHRDGERRSFQIADVSSKTSREKVVRTVSR
jgi:hypothetical protein